MRQFINIIESTDKFHFDHEGEITRADLEQIYNGVDWVASTERYFSTGAAAFYRLTYEDKVKYFNEKVIPIYKKHNLPIPGKPPYGAFQKEIENTFRAIKKQEGVDYTIYQNILDLLGL